MTTVPLEVQARERVNRQMRELAEMAPGSLAAHAVLIHKDDQGNPIVPARHHLEWIRMLEDVDNYRWLVVIAPPGYAKSTWFSHIYPTWRVGTTAGRIRIGLVSNVANLAFAWNNAIRTSIVSDRFQRVYPMVRPDQDRGWSQQKAWVTGSLDTANPTLFASGMKGPIQGKRFDEIILDDPTTWDEARSEATMDGQRFWVKSMLLERFPPGFGPPDGEGRMVVVMTRWGERDLVPTFVEAGFKVVTMPALGYWDRRRVGENDYEWGTEPLWPERETREQLLAEREENEIIFELVKQGNPRILSGDVFDPNNFQHAAMPHVEEFDSVVSYVDTAGGKDRRKGDFFAMVTLGVRKESTEVWVMHVDRGRYPAPEQEKRVNINAEYFKPSLVCIEDRNEGTALYQRMVANTRLPLKADSPLKDKEFRAIPLANAYRARHVFHPCYEDGEPHRWVRAFETELAAFPAGPHDDQVDAAAGAYNNSGSVGPRLRLLRAPHASAPHRYRPVRRRFR